MALKGTTRIELTNVKTGEKEVIEKDNLVTNAVNDILTLNPYGARFRNYANTYYLGTQTSPFDKLILPLCPNLFGGILLYENALEEDASKYYASMDNPLVGYSSNDVSPGTDVKRGSMNQTESGPLADGTGYRFVFDFATSQGNGTIAALGLTSKFGGQGGYGSEGDKYGNHAFLIDEYGSVALGSNQTANKLRYSNIVSLDVEKGEMIYAYVSAANTITLGKLKFPTTSMGLCYSYTYAPQYIEYSETIIVTSTFATVLSGSGPVFYGTLIDGGDGYIWGFQHEGNSQGNSEGAASVLWIKISKADWSFEEGSWSLDAQLFKFGTYPAVNDTASYSTSKINYAIIKDGVLYAIKYTRESVMYGVYSIPLDNPTNITLLELEGRYRYFEPGISGYYNSTAVNEINGVIMYRGWYISGGKLNDCHTSLYENYEKRLRCLACAAKPGLKYGPYIFGLGLADDNYMGVRTYLQSAYLATINNLVTPVQKTADKTMKITYILREDITTEETT